MDDASNPCIEPNEAVNSCPTTTTPTGVAFSLKVPHFVNDINSHLLTTAELELPLNLIEGQLYSFTVCVSSVNLKHWAL